LRRYLPVLLLAFGLPLFGQMPADTDRLLSVGRLWVTINYFHPHIAERDINWDAALIQALPAICAAKTPVEYAHAVQSMLDGLQDPATYVFLAQPTYAMQGIRLEMDPGRVLTVSQTPEALNPNSISQLLRALQQAKRIVFDLRGGDYLSHLLDQPEIANQLTPVPLDTPAQKIWIHHGLASPVNLNTEIYYSAFEIRPGMHFPGNPASKAKPITFLLEESSHLPRIASALTAANKAQIQAASAHYTTADSDTIELDLGANVKARVRLSEPVSSLTPSASPVIHPDRDDTNSTYPSSEYRILATYKVWGVFHYFFAYRDQMDEDWDEDFKKFLPKIVSASNAQEYHLAIAEFVSQVHDSNAQLHSRILDKYFGEAPVGLRLQLIEKKAVITGIVDDDAKKAGIQPGDIIRKVAGESLASRANREARYIPASTQKSLAWLVLQRVLNGPDDSIATVMIEDAAGHEREVKLRRKSTYKALLRPQRTGEVVQLFSGNIGYVDLDRLKDSEVDSMFERLQNAKAIIFDMRGYPSANIGEIASRLTNKQEAPAALLSGPLTLAPDLPNGETLSQNASYFLVQRLPRTTKPRYLGKTVMLIDERASGAAEHAGLLFEAANGTKFIGTPTAGADGTISSFLIPGGITIDFSGLDVRHINGGQLQRLGLQPFLEVAPTLAGIRAGRDEVLEKALSYLSATDERARLLN
jgi:C-terminal processing protease CtpA/Prc